MKYFRFIVLDLILLILSSCGYKSQVTVVGYNVNPKSVSAKNSTLIVSSSTVSSNSSVNITLNLLDQKSLPYPLTSQVITFSASGGTSTGQFSAVTKISDGVYTATFFGLNPGTATTIKAQIDGVDLASTFPTVQVVPVTPSPSHSLVSVSQNLLTAGDTATITLTANDSDSHQLSTGGASVAFTISGGISSGTLGVVTDHQDGTYTATFTATTAGSITSIHATIDGNAVTTTMPTLTVSPGAAASIAVSSGNTQSAVAGSALSSPLIAIVKDAYNNVVPSALVQWTILSGGGSLSTSSQLTDASGLSQSSLTLGSTIGSNSVSASVDGTSLSTTFSATGVVGAAVSIAVLSGDAQSAIVGTNAALPLVVVVKDAHNNPVSGVSVNWAVVSGGGAVSSCSPSTNASGYAQCTLTLGTIAGANSVTATINGTTYSASFSASGNAGAAASIAVVSGDLQTATVGAPAITTLVAVVKDAYQNLINGASVSWSVTAGNGSLSSCTSSTNASGEVQCSFTLGVTAGTNTITATTTGPIAGATFNLTGASGAATKLAFIQGPSDANLNTTMSPSVTVQALDSYNNTVTDYVGQIVMAIDGSNNPGAGTLSGTLSKAASSGLATFDDLAINNAGINYKLRATSGSLTSILSDGFTISGSAPVYITTNPTDTDSVVGARTQVIKNLNVNVTSPATFPSTLGTNGTYSSVYASSSATCATATNGDRTCWGYIPFIPNPSDYLEISIGWGITCGINNQQDLMCAGDFTGSNILGDGLNLTAYTPVAIDAGTKYAHISTYNHHTCGITTSGVLKCWGSATGTEALPSNYPTPTEMDHGVTYSSISVGSYSSCGITTLGDLKCWGNNGRGQLGDGTFINNSTPHTIGSHFASVSLGELNACAITTGGELKCWGYDGNGQVGFGGRFGNISTPQTIGAGYTSVSSGYQHVCALTTGGEIKCWGTNSSGQIGDGSTNNRFDPVTIGQDYIAMTTGGFHTCGIKTNHSLYCWGAGWNGQLANGLNMLQLAPPSPKNLGLCTIDHIADDVGMLSNVVCTCTRSSCSIMYDANTGYDASADISYTILDGTGTYSASGVLSITQTQIVGCSDDSANNYNSNATLDDGSCSYNMGCTDSRADNYDPSAVRDNGSCAYHDGCTDGAASNYDPNAMNDNGSCYVSGCTDYNAYNYNPNATQNDGSCDYTPATIEVSTDGAGNIFAVVKRNGVPLAGAFVTIVTDSGSGSMIITTDQDGAVSFIDWSVCTNGMVRTNYHLTSDAGGSADIISEIYCY